MFNTTSSSKSAVRFTLNFFDKTITGTKASFNKANKGFGPEYEELTSKMAAHPDFTLVVKEQKTKTTKAKRTYEGMDYKFMEDYIATFEDASLMKKYQTALTDTIFTLSSFLLVCYTSRKPQRKVPKWRTMENATSLSACCY